MTHRRLEGAGGHGGRNLVKHSQRRLGGAAIPIDLASRPLPSRCMLRWVPAQRLRGGERVVVVGPPGWPRDAVVAELSAAGAPPVAVAASAAMLRRSAIARHGHVVVTMLATAPFDAARALPSARTAAEAEAAVSAAATQPGALAVVDDARARAQGTRIFFWAAAASADPVSGEPPEVVASDGEGYRWRSLAGVAGADPWFRSPVTAEVLRGVPLAAVPPDGAIVVLGLPVVLPHSEQLSVRIAWRLPPDEGVVLVALRRGGAWMHPPVVEEAAPAVRALAKLFGADLLAGNTACLANAVLWWPACPGGGTTVEQWWADNVGC